MENTKTEDDSEITAFSTRFIINDVFPIEGRPATIMRSAGCNPDVISSMSLNPELNPVSAP